MMFTQSVSFLEETKYTFIKARHPATDPALFSFDGWRSLPHFFEEGIGFGLKIEFIRRMELWRELGMHILYLLMMYGKAMRFRL